MFTIDKTFEFCYGHRVWTQKLQQGLSGDLKCACRHLHGHEAKVQVYLSSDTLDSTSMVTDFRNLEWLKKFFNTYVDHRFILDSNDPMFESMINATPYNIKGIDGLTKTLVEAGESNYRNVLPHPYGPSSGSPVAYELDLDYMMVSPGTPAHEYLEGFLIVDFVPTSENLSKWVFNMVKDVLGRSLNRKDVIVEKVDWWETPKSRSTYMCS